MTTVLLKAGAVMNDEMQRLKNVAVQYFSDMHVEYVVTCDGRETIERARILNPELEVATTDQELDDALVMALARCPMPTLKSLQIRRVLADVRRCANNQA
ncbi:hypothetical protein D3C72_722240 [compost metagenome]